MTSIQSGHGKRVTSIRVGRRKRPAIFIAKLAGLFLLAPLLSIAVPETAKSAPLSQEPSRVIYQVYVRAFFETGSPAVQDRDGHGDFAGLAAKVSYFQELGVDTLLLMPIFFSTGNMGYIPRDYDRLDPHYGSLAQWRHLVDQLHKADIKVIIDAPVNHISWDSAWFLRGSQRNCDPNDPAHDPLDPDNRYCDFFYFSHDPCHQEPFRFWHKPWHYHETDCLAVWFPRPHLDLSFHRPEWVYATFFSVMPDLRFWDFSQGQWHEPVVQEIERVLQFWTRTGVDGFRIDAAKHFVEGERTNANAAEPRNLALLARLLQSTRIANPDVSFIGEIYGSYDEIDTYVSTHSLDMVFDFPFMHAVRQAVGDRYGEAVKNALRHQIARQAELPPGSRVVLAGNHDVSRMFTQWPDDEERLRLAHFVSLLSPFTPVLYYGEELGMYGEVKRPDDVSDEEYVRTINAFPWHGRDPQVGFPTPPIEGPAENYSDRNLELLRSDPGSSWHLVRRLLQIRSQLDIDHRTTLSLREDLYGHVIGWTLKTALGQCLTAIVNFSATETFRIPAEHAGHAGSECGDRPPRVEFAESAAMVGPSIDLQPSGKIVLR